MEQIIEKGIDIFSEWINKYYFSIQTIVFIVFLLAIIFWNPIRNHITETKFSEHEPKIIYVTNMVYDDRLDVFLFLQQDVEGAENSFALDICKDVMMSNYFVAVMDDKTTFIGTAKSNLTGIIIFDTQNCRFIVEHIESERD